MRRLLALLLLVPALFLSPAAAQTFCIGGLTLHDAIAIDVDTVLVGDHEAQTGFAYVVPPNQLTRHFPVWLETNAWPGLQVEPRWCWNGVMFALSVPADYSTIS